MDFMTVLATASKSLEIAKAIKEIDRQIGEADLKAKAAELLSNIADLKIALVEAKEELQAKQQEISDLENAILRKEEMVRVQGYLYEKGSDGKPTGHPFCPVCDQDDAILMNTTTLIAKSGMPEQCPRCKAEFYQVSIFR